MKQIARLGFIILLGCLVTTALAATKPVLPVQHWQTKNGAQVYFVAAPELPIIDIQVVFDAGSARDAKQAGLAQATNAMLNEGAGKLSADQIAAQFDNVGAQYDVSVNQDMASIHLRSLVDAKFLNPALQTFTTVITAPNFPSDAWKRVQKQTLIGIQAEQQAPMKVASNNFFKTLYANQPYAHPVLGEADTVEKLMITDLQRFYKQYYVAKNAIVAIVGAIDRQKAEQLAEQLIAQLPARDTVKPLPMAAPTDKAQAITVNFPGAQTAIMIGQVGINRISADYFPLYVGNYTLGGGVLVSRLFEEVRNKRGLTYGVSSRLVPLYARGPFYIGLQTRSEQVSQAISVTQQTLKRFVQMGPTDQELQAAKKHITAEFLLNFGNNTDVLNRLITIAFYHLPLDYYDTYRQKVTAVTTQQVKEAFQRTIQLDKMLIVTVGKSPVSNK